ncbi:MAG: 2-isopropylmalate synthase [Spirochaetes bacterium]|jgi:2-isopropylmalate synthase|nr:2-isopropylmalate synthase [Spirochaetota bacterium]
MKPRYAAMKEIKNENREWPSKKIEVSPQWCAVDLRDGNQALPNPMTPEQKLEYFKLLVDIGFKQIEVGFPSASEDDFRFCRDLIEKKIIPDDVTISVLVPSRKHLIERTIEALKGAPRAVIHQYIATSDLHMNHVFGMTRGDVLKMAVEGCALIKQGVQSIRDAGNYIGLEFSPEEFTDTDLDFAIEICDAVVNEWNPDAGEKVILNLPMTVERRLPNEYADMIEVFMRNNKNADRTIVSVHAHNDMGCAVAASTLTLMAGAQRVEGTLFGHGERTGNLDLVTIALNLEYLGVDTGLDFSNLDGISSIVERVTDMPIHARHPYSGQLVFTAFSGSHQDAINKGFNKRNELIDSFGGWKIPYLHVDPNALGRSFEKFIRINSQSGKGGIAFVLKSNYNIEMPKWGQIDFARIVQHYADTEARELTAEELWDLFQTTYLEKSMPVKLNNYWPRPDDANPRIINGELDVTVAGKNYRVTSQGNGPISALVSSLREIPDVPEFVLDDYYEDSTGHSADARAVCFMKLICDSQIYVGAGVDPNVNQAAVDAVFSALNRVMSHNE